MQRTRNRTYIPATALTFATVFLALVGCSALRRPGPTVDRTEDPRITQEVIARLEAEPAIDASVIRVQVDGGIVKLYGSVSGIGQWQCAIRNAELVRGVRSVVDYLVLERGPTEINCVAPRDLPLEAGAAGAVSARGPAPRAALSVRPEPLLSP